MKISPYYIIKTPILTEESSIQSETRNQYHFKVDPKANKHQIRDAIEQLFKVRVESVNTMNYLGKPGRKLTRGKQGRKPDWKKAIVTVHEGDKIELI